MRFASQRLLKSSLELAEVFSVDRRVVNRLISLTKLPVRAERGCRLYDLEEAIEAFIEEKEAERAMSEIGRIRMLKRKQVAEMLGVCTKTVDKYLKLDSDFPKPCKIGFGGSTFRWIESEVESYAQSRRVSGCQEAA